MELVYETARTESAEPDARAKALAYAEAARGLPSLLEMSRSLLSEAARNSPDDTEIYAALGLSLKTREPLERALALGSKSVEVRQALAAILADRGEFGAAAKLLDEAIRLAPYDAPSFLELARIQARQGREADRLATLKRLRSFDPANPELEQ